MAKSKLTDLQKQYQKERKRLLQAERRAYQKGYVLEKSIVPDMPKRVTKKSLEKIKAITPADIRKKATLYNIETGELIATPRQKTKKSEFEKKKRTESYKKRRKKKEKKYYPKKSALESLIESIENENGSTTELRRLQETLSTITRGQGSKPMSVGNRTQGLLNILSETIQEYEDNLLELESYLIENEEEIFMLVDRIEWDSEAEEVSRSFAELGRILNMGSLLPIQAEQLNEDSEMGTFSEV